MILFSNYLCYGYLPELLLSSSEEFPSSLHERNKEENISGIISDTKDNIKSKMKQISKLLLFLTTKQKHLQLIPTDLLPLTKLILGNWRNSKKLSVTTNYRQELEFKNKTKNTYDGFSYLDFILNPFTNYIVHIKLE